jgi:hypothetical protein
MKFKVYVIGERILFNLVCCAPEVMTSHTTPLPSRNHSINREAGDASALNGKGSPRDAYESVILFSDWFGISSYITITSLLV